MFKFNLFCYITFLIAFYIFYVIKNRISQLTRYTLHQGVQRPPNCAPPSSSLERLESGKENGGWERFERFGISVTAFSYKGDYSPISRQPSFVGSQLRNRSLGKNVQHVTMSDGVRSAFIVENLCKMTSEIRNRNINIQRYIIQNDKNCFFLLISVF